MGSTTSIYATLLLVAIITVVGTAIGIICGWCGGIPDTVLMRVSDLFLAFPSLEMCIRDRCYTKVVVYVILQRQ